jgi:hypothetical protein
MEKSELLFELKQLLDDGFIDHNEYELLKKKIVFGLNKEKRTTTISDNTTQQISNNKKNTNSNNRRIAIFIISLLFVIGGAYIVLYSGIFEKEKTQTEDQVESEEGIDGDHQDQSSDDIQDQYVVKYKPIEKYALPKEGDIQLDWRFNETYNQFIDRYKKQTPSFAGYFVVIEEGCGTCCRTYQIIDTRDGKIYSSPKKNNWEEGSGSGFATYKRESSLFTVVMDDCGFGDGWSDTLYSYWDDSKKMFKEVPNKNKHSGLKKSPSCILPTNFFGNWVRDSDYTDISCDWGFKLYQDEDYKISFLYEMETGGKNGVCKKVNDYYEVEFTYFDEMTAQEENHVPTKSKILLKIVGNNLYVSFSGKEIDFFKMYRCKN